MTSTALQGFPFPFPDDRYRYSTNVEPAGDAVATPAGCWGAAVLDIDGEYEAELAERAEVLAADPGRYALLPHMVPAAWDAMLTLMRELSSAFPERCRLTSLGADRWHWRNDPLGIDCAFRYGDQSTLPAEPLPFIAGQVQEDIALLDQRAGQLFVDAGLITFAADWSFGFDVGMSFLEIHGPVPRVRAEGVITRAHEFLLRLQPHQPYRRTNWTMTIGRRLDVSTERYPQWGPDREMILQADDRAFGALVHLRVEVQHLIRLPDSGAVMFLIRTYLLPLEQLAAVEPWRARTAAVLAELPDDMAEYKGIIKYRDRAAAWLVAAAGDAPCAPSSPAPSSPAPASPGPGMPQWPASPPEVDPTGAAYLVVAIGAGPEAVAVAGGWADRAGTLAPTRLLALDSLADPVGRDVLRAALDQACTGTRVLVAGGQYDVLTALALAREHGAIAAELTSFVTHTRDVPMYCAHCRDTFRVDGAAGDVVRCPGCARQVEIHAHHSARLGSFLASSVQDREAS